MSGAHQLAKQEVGEVVVDQYAGTQTLGKLRRKTQQCYIPLDKREKVWSAAHMKFVKNVYHDIAKETPREVMTDERETHGMARV